MKTRNKAPKFIGEDELPYKVKEWRRQSSTDENRGEAGMYSYKATRIEGGQGEVLNSGYDIRSVHGESFLGYIDQVLVRRELHGNSEKFVVFDIGGGAGLYAQQIRDRFGDKVRVYTSGLKKRTAEKAKGGKLHKDDLKWRSVLQLKNFPEFDLILDTFGEKHYSSWLSNFPCNQERYFTAVINKLKFGGRASIVAKYVPEFLAEIKKFCEDNFAVDVEFDEKLGLIKIQKHKQKEEDK